MNILLLPRYGRLGASSRLRTMQYVPALRSTGAQVDVLPFLADSYLDSLYWGSVSAVHVIQSYVRRARALLARRSYDVIWAEKELFPWLPAAFDLILASRRSALVLDYDDAIFHRYDTHESRFVRTILGSKIDAVMHRADVVVAGNRYLSRRAKAAGCRWVEWLPTVVDLDRYAKPTAPKPDQPAVVGWIGSPATAGYLKHVVPAINELMRSRRIRCVAIGARPDQVSGTPFEAWPWREGTEESLLRQLDIGIMPLPYAPWERGKCGYKLIQYMACGLPVVASPVGANRDIVSQGINGYFAVTTNDWIDALETLVDDSALRLCLGKVGRRRVEEVYCLQVQAPRLSAILRAAARSRR